jgi:uncharacterized protein YbjT (DUF2867 family)
MRNSKSMHVLVYGGTGTQASPIISELLKRGHQPVVISRTREKLRRYQQQGVQVFETDFSDKRRLLEINKGIDIVSLLIPFFLPNPLDGIDFAINAIDAAKNSNVKMIIWNSSGIIPEKKIGNPAIDIRIDIKEILSSSGLPFIIFQPTIYNENLLGPWSAPFVKKINKIAYPVSEDIQIGWISSKDVCALIVAAMERQDLEGSSFKVSGEKLSGKELANKFSIGLERNIEYYPLPPIKFGEVLDNTFGAGAGEKAVKEYRKIWDDMFSRILFLI